MMSDIWLEAPAGSLEKEGRVQFSSQSERSRMTGCEKPGTATPFPDQRFPNNQGFVVGKRGDRPRFFTLLIALMLAGPSLGAQTRLTEQMWADIRPVYAKTLQHPFLRGLGDGTLPKARFQFYLQQDGLYLRAFAQALNVLAAKAPREDWSMTLSRHAIEAIEGERQLHETILKSYGVTAEKPAMAPTNAAYTNHLLATVQEQPFAQGLAAMLPCYWVYWEVGKELTKRGSRNPVYQKWIQQYGAESFGKVVAQVLAMMDEEGRSMPPAARQEARRLFERSARYEWMFWEMAWREERWPPQ